MRWIVARPDAIRDLVTVIDMAATVEDEACLLAALGTLRAVLSVGALAQTLLQHKVKVAQVYMRLGELLGDRRHAVYCEAASVLSAAVRLLCRVFVGESPHDLAGQELVRL